MTYPAEEVRNVAGSAGAVEVATVEVAAAGGTGKGCRQGRGAGVEVVGNRAGCRAGYSD